MLGKCTIKDNGTSGSGLFGLPPLSSPGHTFSQECFFSLNKLPLFSLCVPDIINSLLRGARMFYLGKEFTTKGVFEAIYSVPCPVPWLLLGIREPKFRFPVWITFFIKITITFTTRILIHLLRDQLQGLFGVGPELSPHCADYPVIYIAVSPCYY